MQRVPGRQILGLPVLSMMPHQRALPSVAGCATRKSRENGHPLAIDQETDHFTTIFSSLDEFVRRPTVFRCCSRECLNSCLCTGYSPFPAR